MVGENGVLGMAKYAAARCVSKYLVGKESMEEYCDKLANVWMWST